MNRILINEAEAIIEPFYDGGTGDHTDTDHPRYRSIDEYKVTQVGGAQVELVQGWAFAELYPNILPTEKDSVAMTMERTCDLCVKDYDCFMVFASMAHSMKFSLYAELDGKWQKLFDRVPGTGLTEEVEADFCGEHLTGIKIEIYASELYEKGNITWFGLANKARREEMLARKSYYDNTWPGFFKENPVCEPELSILFGADDLPALREKLSKPPFDKAYNEKKAEAIANMSIVPEDYIGRYVPTFDMRWNRTRDADIIPIDVRKKDALGMHSILENLAFVGIVEDDKEMMKMAARHAFAISHCEYWSESFIGNLPGATWHHRSFTEQNYCRAVSLTLDWCGGLMTPFAKQVIRDALAKKGLPQIESDFRRIEYIRHMNQGIVFGSGRIFALTALVERYPRYQILLDEAERDMIEMIDNYVQEDGGTLEGPSYWMFTFSEAIGAFYVLARNKKVPFTYYKDVFSKTGEFALSSLSLHGDGTTIMPINDAPPGKPMHCSLACSFAEFTDSPAWKQLYAKLVKLGHIDKDTFALISAKQPTEITEIEEFCRLYPITGQLDSVRNGKQLKTRMHLCTGPTYMAHYNEDKGSIIVEAENSTICPDPGSAYYYEAELFWIRIASAHSLLYPVRADGLPSIQGRHSNGGTALKYDVNGQCIDFMSDDTLAWEDEVFEYSTRRLYSPFAELTIIEDSYGLKNAVSVEFLLNCFGEWKIEENKATATVDGIKLTVMPLNWEWENARINDKIQDGEHRPIWQLIADCNKKSAVLKTALMLSKNTEFTTKKSADEWEFVCGDEQYIYKV